MFYQEYYYFNVLLSNVHVHPAILLLLLLWTSPLNACNSDVILYLYQCVVRGLILDSVSPQLSVSLWFTKCTFCGNYCGRMLVGLMTCRAQSGHTSSRLHVYVQHTCDSLFLVAFYTAVNGAGGKFKIFHMLRCLCWAFISDDWHVRSVFLI